MLIDHTSNLILMASDEEQEARVAKRILRYLRDWYNQDVKRPVLVNSIAGNIGEDVTLVENYLEKVLLVVSKIWVDILYAGF